MQGLGSVSPLANEPGHTPQFLTPALSGFIALSRALNQIWQGLRHRHPPSLLGHRPPNNQSFINS
jgi:hypothetical protein